MATMALLWIEIDLSENLWILKWNKTFFKFYLAMPADFGINGNLKAFRDSVRLSSPPCGGSFKCRPLIMKHPNDFISEPLISLSWKLNQKPKSMTTTSMKSSNSTPFITWYRSHQRHQWQKCLKRNLISFLIDLPLTKCRRQDRITDSGSSIWILLRNKWPGPLCDWASINLVTQSVSLLLDRRLFLPSQSVACEWIWIEIFGPFRCDR